MLAGKLVNLWSIESFDLTLTREWLLDSELVGLCAVSPYLSSGFELDQWHQRLLNDPLLKVFAIKTKDGLHIGNIELSGWDVRASSAEIGLFLGNKQYRCKGYGRDAINTVLTFSFMEFNLHRIFARIASFNENGITFFKSSGFVEEGRLRESYFSNGKYWDVVLMGILVNEFLTLSNR